MKKRKIIRATSYIAIAAMAVSLFAGSVPVDSAKAPSLNMKRAEIKVGEKLTVNVKNSNKKATVKWKSSKKSVAAIKSSVNIGKKAKATIIGKKKGTAIISATYKLGRKTRVLKCKVVVKKPVTVTAAPVVTTAPADNNIPVQLATSTPANEQAVMPTKNPTTLPTSEPTAEPTEKPTSEPTATPTEEPTSEPTAAPTEEPSQSPTQRPDQLATVKPTITPHPTKTPKPTVKPTPTIIPTLNPTDTPLPTPTEDINVSYTVDFSKENVILGSNAELNADNSIKITAVGTGIDTKIMLPKDVADKNYSKVTIKYELESGIFSCKYLPKYKTAYSDTYDGYYWEYNSIYDFDANTNIKTITFDMKAVPVSELVIFDVHSAGSIKINSVVFEEPCDETELQIENPTEIYYTDKGAEIIKAAAIPEGDDAFEEKDYNECWENQKTKKMSFVDTSFWTDVYEEYKCPSIRFENVSIPGWQGNADRVELASEVLYMDGSMKDSREFISTRKNAQGYVIWDKEYLYVLFDVNDRDISPASTDHFTTDSTEFFLDENCSAPDSYFEGDGDEVQLRIDAVNNAFSANDMGTNNFDLVAHAVNYKKDADDNTSGYQIEYIIKLHDRHVSGDIMGMDLQINDCYTEYEYIIDEDGYYEINSSVEPYAARAAVLTAYDTTNNNYQYPNCFGCVRLINKNEPYQPQPTNVPKPTQTPRPQATEAPNISAIYYTEKGAEIIKSAAIPEGDDTFEEIDDYYWWTNQKTKTMNFVDTSFWTDVYNEYNSPSLRFENVMIPSWQGNADRVGLAREVLNEDGTAKDPREYISTRKNAQGYVIWDEDYLYVLYDVNDSDISPANDDHYTTDSTEFFLDENYSQPTSYADGDGDEVQLRIDAANGAFSSNEAGTGNYELVAHAVNYKKDADNKTTGYQVEYIIKLNNEHKNGDIMGMDLQINDCYTEYTYIYDEYGDIIGIDETIEPRACRASVLSVFDPTFNNFQDPSCFGRVKLISHEIPEVSYQPIESYAPATESPVTPVPTSTLEPTATPEPTSTPVPTFGAIIASDNVSPSAIQVNAPITVDGSIDTVWNDVPAYAVKSASEDSQALVKLAWDADALYALVRVKDAEFDSSSSNKWERDGGEIFLDEDNSKEDTYDDNTDAFQFRYSGFDTDRTTTIGIVSGSDNAKEAYSGIEAAHLMVDDGYIVEYKIPWANKDAITAGKKVGFDINVYDCSNGTRLQEMFLFANGGALWKDPSLFGEIELKKDEYHVDITKFKTNGKVTATVNEDGSVTLDWPADAPAWANIECLFDAPKDLSKYTNYIVKTKGGETIFCASILDATKKSQWGAKASVGLKYGFETNKAQTLASLLNGDYNGDNAGGTDADYTNVAGVSFDKNNEAKAVNVTITDIIFY